MIPNFIVVDGVNTTLADAVSTTSTTITLASSSNLPTLGSGQSMPLILQSASNASANEVVYVTAISGASLTVVRGQEGTSAQNFAVGDLAFCGPTAGTVPLLGIQTLQPTASVSITPSYMTTIVQPDISAAATITIEPGTVVGQRVRVYGGAYAVTDQPNVTTGSPYFGLPDGSEVYSWVIPAGATDEYIDHVWDGANWRCTTAGQTVVAAATQSNAAVQLGQVTSTQPVTTRTGVGTPAANTTYSASISLTAPTAGFLYVISFIEWGDVTSASVTNNLLVNGASVAGDNGTLLSVYESGSVAVSAGSANTIEATLTTGTTAPNAALVVQLAVIFIPNP